MFDNRGLGSVDPITGFQMFDSTGTTSTGATAPAVAINWSLYPNLKYSSGPHGFTVTLPNGTAELVGFAPTARTLEALQANAKTMNPTAGLAIPKTITAIASRPTVDPVTGFTLATPAVAPAQLQSVTLPTLKTVANVGVFVAQPSPTTFTVDPITGFVSAGPGATAMPTVVNNPPSAPPPGYDPSTDVGYSAPVIAPVAPISTEAAGGGILVSAPVIVEPVVQEGPGVPIAQEAPPIVSGPTPAPSSGIPWWVWALGALGLAAATR